MRTPWEPDSPPVVAPSPLPPLVADPKRRGRRPDLSRPASNPTHARSLYHHLTITGPAVTTEAFAAAARGPGVIPWWIDGAALEEDVSNLAVGQPLARRMLEVAGCRILARQFRDRVEARQARAAALVGAVPRACPFDLHTLLPVPEGLLQLGPTHPAGLAWLAGGAVGGSMMACAMWPRGPPHDPAAGCLRSMA